MTSLTGELYFKLVQKFSNMPNVHFSNCILRDHTIYSTVLQPASSIRKRPIYILMSPCNRRASWENTTLAVKELFLFTSSDPRSLSVVNSATVKISCSIVHTPMPIGRHWNLQIPNLFMQVTKQNHTASITTKLDKHISFKFQLEDVL